MSKLMKKLNAVKFQRDNKFTTLIDKNEFNDIGQGPKGGERRVLKRDIVVLTAVLTVSFGLVAVILSMKMLSDIRVSKTTAERLKQFIDTQNTKIQHLEEEIQDLTASTDRSVSTIRTEAEELNDKMVSVGDQLKFKKEDVDGLKSEIQMLKSEINYLKTRNETVVEKYISLNQDLKELKKKMITSKYENDILKKSLAVEQASRAMMSVE